MRSSRLRCIRIEPIKLFASHGGIARPRRPCGKNGRQRPIRALLGFVQAQTNTTLDEPDAVDYIKRSFADLVAKETSLEERIRAQVNYLRQSFYQNLLSGLIVSDRQAEERAGQLDIEIGGSGYSVILLGQGSPVTEGDPVGSFESKLLRTYIDQAIQEHREEIKGRAIEYQYDRVAVLLTYDEGAAKKDQKEIYSYTEIQENSLVSAILAGEPERAVEILDTIIKDNVAKRMLSPELLSLFVYQVQGSLIRLIGRRQIEQDVRKQLIHELSGMGPAIPLELEQVAESLSISPVYLSHLFVEKTGERLSAFVESIRLREGRKLLEDSLLAVKEIANRIGYSSSGTFIRAFKRANGVTPSAYRNRRA